MLTSVPFLFHDFVQCECIDKLHRRDIYTHMTFQNGGETLKLTSNLLMYYLAFKEKKNIYKNFVGTVF